MLPLLDEKLKGARLLVKVVRCDKFHVEAEMVKVLMLPRWQRVAGSNSEDKKGEKQDQVVVHHRPRKSKENKLDENSAVEQKDDVAMGFYSEEGHVHGQGSGQQEFFSELYGQLEADEHACCGGSSGGACCGDGNSECKSSGESGACLDESNCCNDKSCGATLDKNDTPTSESAAFDNEEAATRFKKSRNQTSYSRRPYSSPVFVALLILRALAFFAPP